MAQSKVFWSPTEKELIAREAARLQLERPDLAGLPLLREAQKVLPRHRRRPHIIATTQVPWFDEMVAEEVKARSGPSTTAIVPNDNDPYVPLLTENGELTRDIKRLLAANKALFEDIKALIDASLADQAEFTRRAVTFLDKVLAGEAEFQTLLRQVLAELRKLNKK